MKSLNFPELAANQPRTSTKIGGSPNPPILRTSDITMASKPAAEQGPNTSMTGPIFQKKVSEQTEDPFATEIPSNKHKIIRVKRIGKGSPPGSNDSSKQ